MATSASQQASTAAHLFFQNTMMSSDEKTAKTSEMHTGSSIQAAQSKQIYITSKHMPRVYTEIKCRPGYNSVIVARFSSCSFVSVTIFYVIYVVRTYLYNSNVGPSFTTIVDSYGTSPVPVVQYVRSTRDAYVEIPTT